MLLLASCSAALGEAADTAVQDTMRKLGAGDIGALWAALPASYQQDISYVIYNGAATIDPAAWDKGFELGRKVVDVLKTKKQMILASSMVAQHPDLEKVEAAYDPFVEILSLLFNSEISKLENVKKLDVGKFAAGTGTKLGKRIMAFQEAFDIDVMGIAKLAAMREAKVTLVGTENGVATLSIEMPDESVGAPVPFVQVDDKWTPKAMADDWADWVDRIPEIRSGVQSIEPDPESAPQIVAMFSAMISQLDLLARAENQAQFDEMLKTVAIGMVMQVQLQQQLRKMRSSQPRRKPHE